MKLLAGILSVLVSLASIEGHESAAPCDADMDYDNARLRDAERPEWSLPGLDDRIVLENQYARVVVWPNAGGAITEYLHKVTGTNLVAGSVEPGKCGFGWKTISRLKTQDPPDEWVGSRPHQARRVKTPMGPGIEVGCCLGDLESRRVIVLDPNSSKLTVTCRETNKGTKPRRIFLRWHPYMMIGDPFAESSGIFLPDVNGNLRQIKVGGGWDNSFLNPGGFVLAANWKTGEGLWMTYESQKIPLLTTWTDYKHGVRHPLRGAFTVEPWVLPELKGPGESIEVTYVYFPFCGDTPLANFPLDLLEKSEEQDAARRFLRLVRPHAGLISNHSMVSPRNTAEAAIEENRFFFSHRRRDRMALKEWGIADALFAMPGIQSLKARARYFAKRFPENRQPVELIYVFFVRDGQGKRVIEQTENISLDDAASAEVDLRREFDLSELDDGRYDVGVEVYEKGNDQPIHRVTESRKLIGRRRAEIEKTPPQAFGRAFVKALGEVSFEAGSLKKLNVPIGVEEAAGIPRKNWPVMAGMPFAKGMVFPDSSLVLRDPKGKEVGFDSTVSGTWEDGSVRWLLLNFAADVPANGFAFYYLESGQTSHEPPPLLLAQDQAGIRFDNDRQHWNWSGSSQLGPLTSSGLWWTDGSGRTYRFELRGEGAGLEIEQNGRFRAVVRATGWYYAEGVTKPVARGILRFEGYRDQPQLRIFHNVVFAGNPWREKLGSFGLKLPLPGLRSGPVEVALDGKSLDVIGGFTLDQINEDTCRFIAGDRIIKARRADGGLSFPLHSGNRIVIFRNFWKMAPKVVRLKSSEASEVVFDYWPEEGGGMSFLPREDGWLPSSSSAEALATGMGRTQELIVLDSAASDLKTLVRAFDEPVLAIVPPKYLTKTDAMMHLQPYDPDRWPEIETAISRVFDTYLLNQELWGWYGQWTYGTLPNLFLDHEYRWADFGRYAHILNEQDIVQTAWLAYMRSGDRKYFKFAEANTRQLMEVSTINWNDVWPEEVGLSRRHHECPWLSSGDYGHSMLDPFLDMYRMTGYRPAWDATQAMADAMTRQQMGTWRYLSNPVAGLARMALETQDPNYRAHADRLWRDLCYPERNNWWIMDHGSRAAMYYAQINPECETLWRAWALRQRPARFVGMDAMAALYKKSGDPNYAEAALRDFQNSETQLFGNGLVRRDPLRWGIEGSTQAVLAGIRRMVYAGSAVEAARKLVQEGKIPERGKEIIPEEISSD